MAKLENNTGFDDTHAIYVNVYPRTMCRHETREDADYMIVKARCLYRIVVKPKKPT